MHKPLLLLSLILIFSCNSQEQTAGSNNAKHSPVVVRNFKAKGIAPDYDTTLVSQFIRSIFHDSKGNLWFGTIDEGVVRYNVDTLKYFSSSEGFVCQTVYAINEDHQGNMWFGTEAGLYKYDGKTFRNYTQVDGLEQIEISRKGLVVDRSGNLWVGTHKGVFRFNPEADGLGQKSFSSFTPLADINVAGMYEDKKGNIWFATYGKGVFSYDGKSIFNYAEKEALGENYAGGITEDKNGNMWFTMRNGICKYDGKTFTEYTAKDGLQGAEFWGITIEESGIIWITTRGGTTRFDPTTPLPNPNAFVRYTPEDGFTCCVQSMLQDKNGRLWFGTGQGLYTYEGNNFHQVKQSGPW